MLAGFIYDSNTVQLNTNASRLALKQLHRLIVGDSEEFGLVRSSVFKESGVLFLEAKSLSSDISLHLVETIFESLSNYYIAKTTEKQKHAFDIISQKTDSIQNELDAAQYRMAKFRDSNRNLALFTSEVEAEKLQAKSRALLAMLTEAVKNRETAEIVLKNVTPFIQVVDRPIPPLNANKPNFIIAFILGSIVGGILGVLFIVLRKLYSDIINS